MGKGVGCDVTAGLLLQAVVTNGTGRPEPFLEISRFQQLPSAIGVMRPDTSKTVCLQFQSNRRGIGFCLRHLTPGRLDLARYAQEILNMMSHLMSDDVGLGKVSRGAET